jgi:soluble lytic murein transglycosylase-like protein
MRLSISAALSVACLLFFTLAEADAQAMVHPPSAVQRSEILAIAERHADKNGLPPTLVAAIITVESSWFTSAKNGSSVGLMQITPGTARSLGFSGSLQDLFDPETNIRFGTLYLAEAYRLADGDLCATVVRYQSGLGASSPNGANRAYCRKMKRLLTP